MRIRKKPVVVEAVSVNEILDSPSTTPQWVEDAIVARSLHIYTECVVIQTINGKVRAGYGEYVVRGVRDELYPITYQILQETYEVIE